MADKLRARGTDVRFVGSTAGIEATLVPEAGYPLHALPLAGLSGGPTARARAGLLLLKAVLRCRAILKDFSPGAVLGVGGYASAPAVLAASALKIPTFLHEQNSVPGRVNRFAARFIREVLVAFPAAAEHLRDAVPVGMPTREEFSRTSKEEAIERLGVEPPVVLIFGGSGGALKLNLAAAEAFGDTTPYSVYQISGRRDFARLSTDNPRHRIVAYENDLWYPLAAADVVVTRAGAGSLFDAAAVGRASIIVPYPYATADHQLYNARYFTDRDAGELLLDDEVTAGTMRTRVETLLEDEARRERLARNMHALATSEAADEVADRLLEAANAAATETKGNSR
ncbi:MAG: UDP-N-acetylglucosamine--N-acetylmuramyl-(pentapeptide) pyrophosphoryl-undecaprenol N-acetylglucosamine transferase [uncultured Rubrobacteraceae bacterium]|uniref:UDP-N-acetylglucosamine--N-acetylmuramyl-(pentapeptide) pyrophosphoryl-undecaprenol N-acetylglucosamine transferase n=1 Tax=uncultured Rubrobacteraceae bacterium TaxID=349277 RepID=A0A6J4R164_9ACTN|nr:MAG: UDP-N-acetylglucosamine--N-acetylmuramyl-(pentapeptide) pyrophosphoryl-undecaprenol N-acetylglucosamine transferase [uncultured Rubrobacteraceae bacterium]